MDAAGNRYTAPKMSLLLPGGATVVLGRQARVEAGGSAELDVTSWQIDHKALSREQLRLQLPDTADGTRLATVIGKKPSFVQTATGLPQALPAGVRSPLAADAVVWLWGIAEQSTYQHPIRICPASPPTSAAPAAAPPAAPASVGEWQVRLGGQFKPYDAAVQRTLEAAIDSRGEISANIRVRGQEYIIQSTGGAKFQQVLVSDHTKVRDVRRIVVSRNDAPAPAPPTQPAPPAPPALSPLPAPEATATSRPSGPPVESQAKATRSKRVATPVAELAEAPKRAKASMEPAAHSTRPVVAAGSSSDVDTALSDQVALLRRRAEAMDPNIFDGEMDVDGELRFLLRQSAGECRAALDRVRAARDEAPPNSVLATRLLFVETVIAEQAGEPPAKAKAKAKAKTDGPDGGVERVEMFLMDMQETDGAIDLFGVDGAGSSTLVRVSGFRNFFYVQLSGMSPLPMATEPSPRAASIGPAGAGAVAQVLLGETEGLLTRILDELLPRRLLLHVASAVCHAWRQAAAPILCHSVSRSLLIELPTARAEQLTVNLVQRTPLLAYYGETLAHSRKQQTLTPGALPGMNRSVPMLRVEYAANLKAKDILAAFKRAALASAPLLGLIATTADGEIVSGETGLAPAGTTALLRRFAVERSLAGGGWLVAHAAPASLSTRCARAFSCSHECIEGKAPDILSPKSDQDLWSHIPPISTLSVRVVSTLGFTEPQWEAREATTGGSADGVRMIACEHRKGVSEHCVATVLALDERQRAGSRTTLPAVGESLPPLEIRYFSDEAALLAAFERCAPRATTP